MKPMIWHLLTALLRAGLWERDTVLAAVPDHAQWRALLEAAHAQAVTGLLLRGVSHLPEAQLPPADIRMRLLTEADTLERTHAAITRMEAELLASLSKAGLHPIVQKGSQAAKYYACPALRACGDIDLYLPEAEFGQALQLVPEARRTPDGSAVFARDGMSVELHPRYYDLHLPPEELPGAGSVCGEILLLSAHICKHAIGAGIGLKQLCDLARTLHAAEGRYDKAELQAALRRCGLLRWHRLLCSLLVEDLGLDAACCLPAFRPCNAEPLRRIVRRGGNFGQAAPRRKAALRKGAAVRKADTLAAFLCRLPFSLRYAFRETIATLRELAAGNLRKR